MELDNIMHPQSSLSLLCPCLVSALDKQKDLLQVDRTLNGFIAINSFLQTLQDILM